MKGVLFIVVLFSAFLVHSQEWRENLLTARKLYKEGRYNESLKFYDLAEKKLPTKIDISSEKGQVLYKLNEFKKAEAKFIKSKKNKNAKIYHNLGNAQMEQKKYKEAIESYKKSLRINPNDEEIRYNLSEAIRKIKRNNKNNNNSKKNNNSSSKNDQNNNNNENNKSKDKEKQKGNNEAQSNYQNSNLDASSKKMIDKILEQLSKEDAFTKRKVSSEKGKKSKVVSGKDW